MSGAALLISDVHARYGVVNAQLRHARDELGRDVDEVFVLGDFGFFGDAMHAHFRRDGRRFDRPVACIEGNHEDHGALAGLARAYADVVTHVGRGELRGVGPCRALCLGGARYMDAGTTPRGTEITDADLRRALAHPPDAVDLVLTHDCPDGIGVPNTPGFEHYGAPGVPGLARIAARYRPRWWVFGHHHRWFDVERDGTRYVGLPRSWSGYALLDGEGNVQTVAHDVPARGDVRRRRWLPFR